jgi:hypothetical protein
LVILAALSIAIHRFADAARLTETQRDTALLLSGIDAQVIDSVLANGTAGTRGATRRSESQTMTFSARLEG